MYDVKINLAAWRCEQCNRISVKISQSSSGSVLCVWIKPSMLENISIGHLLQQYRQYVYYIELPIIEHNLISSTGTPCHSTPSTSQLVAESCLFSNSHQTAAQTAKTFHPPLGKCLFPQIKAHRHKITLLSLSICACIQACISCLWKVTSVYSRLVPQCLHTCLLRTWPKSKRSFFSQSAHVRSVCRSVRAGVCIQFRRLQLNTVVFVYRTSLAWWSAAKQAANVLLTAVCSSRLYAACWEMNYLNDKRCTKRTIHVHCVYVPAYSLELVLHSTLCTPH